MKEVIPDGLLNWKLASKAINFKRRPKIESHPGVSAGVHVFYLDKIIWFLKYPN